MRLLLSFILLLVGTLSMAQVSVQDFEKKYKYDMIKEDKINVRFLGETYWLRAATLKDQTVRLTFYKKGDTPTTFRESLTLIRVYGGQTKKEFTEQILLATKPQWVQEPDLLENESHLPTQQGIINLFRQDAENNLFENMLFQVQQAPDASLTIYLLTNRAKLTEIKNDPGLPTREMGSRAGDWILGLDQLRYSF